MYYFENWKMNIVGKGILGVVFSLGFGNLVSGVVGWIKIVI